MEKNCPEGGHHCAIGQGPGRSGKAKKGAGSSICVLPAPGTAMVSVAAPGKSSSSVFEGGLALAAHHGLSSPGMEAASLVLPSKAVVFNFFML